MQAVFYNLIFSCLISGVVGDHFYGGTITWKPRYPCSSGSNVSIMITQTYVWSYSLMPCTSSMVNSNQAIGVYAGVDKKKLQCINNCLNSSTGYSNVNVRPNCISSSSALDTSTTQRSDVVTLSSGNDFWVAYQDSPWRSLATNSNASWSLASNIKVKPRPDNGLYNHAPISNFMSPLYTPANFYNEMSIPVIDPEGDVIRCRWANTSGGVDECGGACPLNSIPSGTDLYSSCDMVIKGSATVGEWYAFTIMVEDFINSTSVTPLSSVPIQFLVLIVAPTTCPSPIVTISPSVGSCLAVMVGQLVALQLLATTNCGRNVSIVDIPIQAFSGVIDGSVYPVNSTTFRKSIYWTPTAAQEGYQMMCTMAIDSENTPPTQYCFTFYVSTTALFSCPTELCPKTTTTTMTTSTSTTPPTSTTDTSTTSITTSSSEPAEYTLYKWLIIGCLVGVPLLMTLIAGVGLCCYYCSPWGARHSKLPDSHESTKDYYMNNNNQTDVYPYDQPMSSRSPPTENISFVEYRPIRPKPKRVTVISLPHSSSPSQSVLIEPHLIADYYRMNRAPDYERNINNVHVRHFRWPEQ